MTYREQLIAKGLLKPAPADYEPTLYYRGHALEAPDIKGVMKLRVDDYSAPMPPKQQRRA